MSENWEQVKRFLARVFTRGKHGVETLAESLDRQAAIQRLSGQIRALNRERQELVKTIGKKVYTLHLRGKVRNRDVLADCKRLDEARDEIQNLQDQMEQIRRQALREPEEAALADETELTEEEAPEAEAAEEEQAAEPEKAVAVEAPESKAQAAAAEADTEEPEAKAEESEPAAE